MTFSERLNDYILNLGCSAKELSDASGVSPAAISRYRAGERVPDPEGGHLRMLSEGIAHLSSGTLNSQEVLEDLSVSISGISVDYETFLANLNALLAAVPVSNNELARTLNFDPSYISRILANQRKPADTQAFVSGVAHYLSRRLAHSASNEHLAELTHQNWRDIEDDVQRAEAIAAWLGTNYVPVRDPLGSFLEKLDSFDLDDFIRAIHFDEMKVPSVPLQLPTTKTYTGIRDMMQAEIDYLKATVLSKSSADLIMFSDMPLEEMAADPDFPKKWMYGMALLLKKGLHLHMIHNTARTLPEMMIGLESWIPVYMTGQISPYYYPTMQNEVFCHFLKVSGTVALSGEAIAGHQAEGRYTLTKNRDEVRYYRRRAERMLEKARPLMRIMTSENEKELATFENAETDGAREWRIIMGTLPIGSIPPEVLDRILAASSLDDQEQKAIRTFAQTRKKRLEGMLGQSVVALEVPDLPREEFAAHPIALELASLFIEHEVAYTYEDYIEHLDALRSLFAKHPESTLTIDRNAPFRNMQIRICKKRYAVVSKNKGPAIHFIIDNPDMVAAFEKFTAPMAD